MNKEIPHNTIIHCPTEELANKVLELLRIKNYIVEFKGNMFSSYKGNLCFSCNYYSNKKIGYSGLDFYIREGLQIIEAEEFLKKYNMEKKEIKVEVPEGMEVDLEKSIMNEHEVSIVYKAIKKNEKYRDICPYSMKYTPKEKQLLINAVEKQEHKLFNEETKTFEDKPNDILVSENIKIVCYNKDKKDLGIVFNEDKQVLNFDFDCNIYLVNSYNDRLWSTIPCKLIKTTFSELKLGDIFFYGEIWRD